ncbi:MAG: hypothetical protein HY929_05810 [Euryarchaeota archaeon]|nr:hypothetical protein [Euryarchaeota archaeon]
MKDKKRINFTPHAREKLKRLLRIGVTEEKVIKSIENPDRLTGLNNNPLPS